MEASATAEAQSIAEAKQAARRHRLLLRSCPPSRPEQPAAPSFGLSIEPQTGGGWSLRIRQKERRQKGYIPGTDRKIGESDEEGA